MMLAMIIILLLNVISNQATTLIIKNESQFSNITIASYYKKICGKGNANILQLNETYNIPDNKKIVLQFSINDFEFYYETKKTLNYVFNIKDDGIYLDDSWGDGLLQDGLLLSSEPAKIFSFE
ncbi:MAG: hypothetical protein P4L22_04580 [Candidatus Babeliales bacterium]|nr:hypothetical protein [Candidatus Babeliales bacterium]